MVIVAVLLFLPYVILIFLIIRHYFFKVKDYEKEVKSVKKDGTDQGEGKWTLPSNISKDDKYNSMYTIYPL
jgi:hypothetical protein